MEEEGQKAENSNLPVPNSTDVREDLVTTAVKFLQNAKVRQSSFAQRRGFLIRKGLTETEIEEAIKRSGTASDETNHQVSTNVPANTAGVVPYAALPPPATRTTWEKLRDILNLATFIGGTLYALYQFYKHFVMKWLFGKSAEESSQMVKNKEVDALEKQLVEVTTNVSELKQLVTQTNEHVQSFVRHSSRERGDTELSRMNVTEIKDEIKSLKSLMLSKKQFPSIPSTSPVLPTWQLRSGASKPLKDSDISPSVGETMVRCDELKQSLNVSISTSNTSSSASGVLDEAASDKIKLDVAGEDSVKVSADYEDGNKASGDQNEAVDEATEAVDEQGTPGACQENGGLMDSESKITDRTE